MKNKLHYFILLFVLAALTGCNEKLSIETEIQGAPEISEFTPTSGKAGTEITVKGSNLRDIVSATIGGVESQILYKLSQQEIVIVVPREGTKSGKISLIYKHLSTPVNTLDQNCTNKFLYPRKVVDSGNETGFAAKKSFLISAFYTKSKVLFLFGRMYDFRLVDCKTFHQPAEFLPG